MASVIIGICPHQFIHVSDLSTNVTYVETGPCTFVQRAHEKVIGGPFPFVVVPPGHYCVIKDPCSNYVKGEAPKLKHGHTDVRFHGEPFPLIPGEILEGAERFGFGLMTEYQRALKPLPIVKANHAIRLRALFDHHDGIAQRKTGDIWQLVGPCTYKPTAEAEILGMRNPEIISVGQALRVIAKEDFTDSSGKKRVTGEEWLVQKPGSYLPDTFEEVLKKEDTMVLEQNKGVHLRATVSLTDSLKKKRQAGDEWLVTCEDTEMLYPQIGVDVVKFVTKTVLSKGQFCIVLDPVDANGCPQLGRREIRCGITSFFLHPGESLAAGIQQSLILGKDMAVVLEAREHFKDTNTEGSPMRVSGERWMVRGPTEYIESVEVAVVHTRKAIPLSKNEGIYVRNIQTGVVRTVHGPQSYLLTEYEELFKKELPDGVDKLLAKGGGDGAADIRKIAYFEQSIDPHILQGRDKTRVVTYRCPGNTACQVYNYVLKTARVVFGPDLVVLGPHENFNVLSISAGKPKKPNALRSLCLMLGPDFISDIIVVETTDHARLQVQLAFNNRFEYDPNDEASVDKLFAVPDFTGFASRQIAGRIRATVAQCPFDEFHRNSASIIRHAVFGTDANGKIRNQLKFEVNNLVISSVDVQSIEPVDMRMRDSLMKSVQMAIEIATSSIEASAKHEAERIEQVARGQLERQKLNNEKEAEKERLILNELRAITAAVESTGQAVAEARANAESALIEAMSQIECTRLRSEAVNIEHSAELTALDNARTAEIKYTQEQNEVEIHKTKELSKIEVSRLGAMIKSVGQDTLQAIATSGPEMQVKLLKGLGIQSTMITDGSTPVNLFDVAKGLVGQ